MQSDGGLIHPSKLSGLHALLSGPAGGVVGYAKTCFVPENPVPVIGFDMGGTSTDVSRHAGSLEHVFETVTAGFPIQVPQLDINTVAAGGGSILSWSKGILTVGPDSAGSHPGPACYWKGGPLTVTDANLILGRIIPRFFPSIFGPNQDQPLDYEASYRKMKVIADEINQTRELKCPWRKLPRDLLPSLMKPCVAESAPLPRLEVIELLNTILHASAEPVVNTLVRLQGSWASLAS